MFELPEAKRIRRDEILSPSSSTRSSPEIVPVGDDEDARARLGKILGFETFTPHTNQDGKSGRNADSKDDIAAAQNNQEDGDNDDEQEFEFRLFSAAPVKKTVESVNANPKPGKDISNNKDAEADDEIKVQKLKIRLRSPTPIDDNKPLSLEDGRFVVPFRGWNYYFTTPDLLNTSSAGDQTGLLETEETRNRRKEFEDIAVTSTELLQWAQVETPGCHLPWRVMHLKPEHKGLRRAAGTTENKRIMTVAAAEEKRKSKKPGKKRRIILRARAAAVAAAAATANMTEAEKRNKKNREKKVRKRQREREKKAALAASTGGAVAPDVEDADSSG